MTYSIFTWTNFGNLGGIQVLINSVADEISASGHDFKLVGVQPEVREFRHRSHYVNFFDRDFEMRLLSELQEERNSDDINIFSFNGASLSISILIREILLRNGLSSKVILGIYHPSVFKTDSKRKITSLFSNILARRLPANSVYFMNSECKRRNVAYLGKKFMASEIIPLPVTDLGYQWKAPATTNHINIYSVGRISKLKGYNYSSAKIAKALHENGINLKWVIYGEGEDEDLLKSLISGQTLVEFQGPIQNECFSELAQKADLFIGMGTAAVQASQLGIPTVLAIEDSETQAHGFAFDAPAANVGEREAERTEKEIYALITEYFYSSFDQRIEISRRCHKWTEQFSFPIFNKSIEALFKKIPERSDNVSYIIAKMFVGGLFIKLIIRRLKEKLF